MPEIHLRQAGFTYRACRLFTKSKDRIRQVKKKAEVTFIKLYLQVTFIKMN